MTNTNVALLGLQNLLILPDNFFQIVLDNLRFDVVRNFLVIVVVVLQ